MDETFITSNSARHLIPSSLTPSATICCARSPKGCIAGYIRDVICRSRLNRYLAGSAAAHGMDRAVAQRESRSLRRKRRSQFNSRPLKLRQAYEKVANPARRDVAKALFHDNPRRYLKVAAVALRTRAAKTESPARAEAPRKKRLAKLFLNLVFLDAVACFRGIYPAQNRPKPVSSENLEAHPS